MREPSPTRPTSRAGQRCTWPRHAGTRTSSPCSTRTAPPSTRRRPTAPRRCTSPPPRVTSRRRRCCSRWTRRVSSCTSRTSTLPRRCTSPPPPAPSPRCSSSSTPWRTPTARTAGATRRSWTRWRRAWRPRRCCCTRAGACPRAPRPTSASARASPRHSASTCTTSTAASRRACCGGARRTRTGRGRGASWGWPSSSSRTTWAASCQSWTRSSARCSTTVSPG
mmetsp:Transcript_10609/g.31604  ORF Transcript_10609/g.31604 Transcript_10609/m.31604 type:complete len:223 (-) Transcript_10609:85-753(-)